MRRKTFLYMVTVHAAAAISRGLERRKCQQEFIDIYIHPTMSDTSLQLAYRASGSSMKPDAIPCSHIPEQGQLFLQNPVAPYSLLVEIYEERR
jgi:hypothetical protein